MARSNFSGDGALFRSDELVRPPWFYLFASLRGEGRTKFSGFEQSVELVHNLVGAEPGFAKPLQVVMLVPGGCILAPMSEPFLALFAGHIAVINPADVCRHEMTEGIGGKLRHTDAQCMSLKNLLYALEGRAISVDRTVIVPVLQPGGEIGGQGNCWPDLLGLPSSRWIEANAACLEVYLCRNVEA